MRRIKLISVALMTACLFAVAAFGQTNKYIAPPVTSTEGYDFMVAFLPNGERFSQAKDLKLQLLISSRPVEGHPEITENVVGIDYADGSSVEARVPVGQTRAVAVDAKKAYWEKGEDIEKPLDKGVHVYSKNGVKMTVFATNQIGTDVATYSLDGSHILPKEAIGHEYIIECNSHDKMTTEFMLMSTKPGTTTVTINLPAGIKTSSGKTKLTAKLTKPYQVYIVRSQIGGDPNDATNPNANKSIDLSGTTLCSDKPIAVWGGNQQAYVPANLPGSEDHTYDQLLPIDRWGTKFIVPMTSQHMLINQVDVVARDNSTQVKITSTKGTQTRTMAQAEKWERVSVAPLGGSLEDSTIVIEASSPIQVYLYTSVAMGNPYAGAGGITTYQGDPSMTMIPPLEYVTDTMIFTTYNGLPLSHELLIWAKASTIATLKLDGTAIPAAQFKNVPGGAPFNTYRYARLPIDAGVHTLTAKEKGFSGYVDGLATGQASLYPIGYEFQPQEDSLFLADKDGGIEVHRSEYNKKYPDNGGWYLDREELPKQAPICDSIFVCDSMTLHFPLKIHNHWDEMKWQVRRYDYSQQKFVDYTNDQDVRKEGSLSNPFLETRFTVQPERGQVPQKRHTYQDFEVKAILYRQPILCTNLKQDQWQKDTLSTIVRVYRSYQDTTWMIKCSTAAKFKFFNDPTGSGSTMSATTFYCPESTQQPAEGADPNFNVVLKEGPNLFKKSYTSVHNCDSNVVLKIFVCKAYNEPAVPRKLCEQELEGLNEEFGRFFTENNPINFAQTLTQTKAGQSNVWKKDTKDPWKGMWSYTGKSTLKTTGCNNAVEEYIERGTKYKGDYRGKDAYAFKGCDSTLNVELHVIPMEIVNYGHVTWCGTKYVWKDASGTILMEIPRKDIGKENEYTKAVNYTSPADWISCPEKLHVLNLAFIEENKILEETITMCEDDGPISLPRSDAVGSHTWNFDPTGKGGQTVQGEVIDFTNPEGCEYKFRYVFKVNDVPRHNTTQVYCYEEEVDELVIEWQGHTSFWWNEKGKTKKTRAESIITAYPPSPKDKDHDTRLIYELSDTLQTALGCHDIYTMTVVVMPKYTSKDTHASITTEDSFEWENRIWAGEDSKQTGSNVVKLVPEGGQYPAGWDVTYEPTTMTYTITSKVSTQPIGGQVCDSTISMTVQIGKIFRDTTYAYTCGGEEFDWIDQNGDQHFVDITVPMVTTPTELKFYDAQKTTYPVPDLDSIWVLVLTVYPSYNYPHTDDACQSLNGYTWTDHMGADHDLWVDGTHLGETEEPIQIIEPGVYVIEDKMLTKPKIYTNPRTGETFSVRCDSSEVMTLTVHPVYTEEFNKVEYERKMTTNDTLSFFNNPKLLFYGDKFDFEAHNTSLEELQEQFGASNVIKITIKKDVETIYRQQKTETEFGCDSITFLTLTVTKAKETIIEKSLGDNNTDWTFGGDEVDEEGNPIHTQPLITGDYFHYYYDDNGNVIGPMDYSADKDATVRYYEFRDTIKTALGADSIIIAKITVYPTYRIIDKVDATCANTPYNWEVYDPETGKTHVHENLNETRNLDDPSQMLFEFEDVLHVMQYRSEGAFDSIRVLQLTILPGRTITESPSKKDQPCDNEVYTWRGFDLVYPAVYYVDSLIVPGFEDCKTAFILNLGWNPTYGLNGDENWIDGLDGDYVACQYENYTWYDSRTGKPHNKGLRDKFGHKYKNIPTGNVESIADASDEGGWWITIYDSLKTETCFCDSVHTLKLYVKKALHDTVYAENICLADDVDEYPYEWTDHKGNKHVTDLAVYRPGHHVIPEEHLSVNGCDSSYYLDINIDRKYDLPVRDVNLCSDVKHFEFAGQSFDEELADSRNWTEPKSWDLEHTFETTLCGCDSTVRIHLTIGPSIDLYEKVTICTGEKYTFDGKELGKTGIYTKHFQNEWGCWQDSTLDLVVAEPTQFEIFPEPVCPPEPNITSSNYTIRYIFKGEYAPISYSIYYDDAALAAGFVDLKDMPITIPEEEHLPDVEHQLTVPVMDIGYPRPGYYKAKIGFKNVYCESEALMTYPFEMTVQYPSWITSQHWNDAIFIMDSTQNGGYSFSHFQWYRNGEILYGETRPYLYMPQYLEEGVEYSVALTRRDDGVTVQTCPIVPVDRPCPNSPQKTYVSVVPTVVAKENPQVYILSPTGGQYKLLNPQGVLISQGAYLTDEKGTYPIMLPGVSGVYVFHLIENTTANTGGDLSRTIKVIVQ